jgi:hypothetical protein
MGLTGLDINPPDLKLPHFSPDEPLGLAFIHDVPDSRKFRASVARKIKDCDASNHQKIKFLIELSIFKLDKVSNPATSFKINTTRSHTSQILQHGLLKPSMNCADTIVSAHFRPS